MALASQPACVFYIFPAVSFHSALWFFVVFEIKNLPFLFFEILFFLFSDWKMSKEDKDIKWMYDGAKSEVNREDYLLGKKVRKEKKH